MMLFPMTSRLGGMNTPHPLIRHTTSAEKAKANTEDFTLGSLYVFSRLYYDSETSTDQAGQLVAGKLQRAVVPRSVAPSSQSSLPSRTEFNLSRSEYPPWLFRALCLLVMFSQVRRSALGDQNDSGLRTDRVQRDSGTPMDDILERLP